MTWKPEIEELERRNELSRKMGGEERIARAREAGRQTVRERIDQLLDPDSFHETGALAGHAKYDEEGRLVDITPSNFICGRGQIDGRPVVVGGDDFTVRGGAADGAVGNKMGWAEKAAHDLRLPLVRLVDGTGGGGSVKTTAKLRRSYVPMLPTWEISTELLSQVPVVAAALGPVAGLGAARVAASHFSVMVRGISQLFVAGPPVVRRALGTDVDKETLGGSHIHARGSGAVDNEATSEADALEQLRRFLSYLPASVWQAPPISASEDDPDARRAELEAELDSMRSPFPTAEVFGIEEIIDPRETRPLLVDWVRCARPIVESQLGPKGRGFRP